MGFNTSCAVNQSGDVVKLMVCIVLLSSLLLYGCVLKAEDKNLPEASSPTTVPPTLKDCEGMVQSSDVYFDETNNVIANYYPNKGYNGWSYELGEKHYPEICHDGNATNKIWLVSQNNQNENPDNKYCRFYVIKAFDILGKKVYRTGGIYLVLNVTDRVLDQYKIATIVSGQCFPPPER